MTVLQKISTYASYLCTTPSECRHRHMKDETIVKWDFAQLFGDVRCVSAKVDAPKCNPDLKRDFLRKIEMSELPRSRFSPPGRHVGVGVMWHSRTDGQHGGSWGDSLFETLEKAGAVNKGCKQHDSLTVYWELMPGERFSYGAMPIVKLLFDILEVKIEGIPAVRDETLISLFVVYKITWVKRSSYTYQRFDDHLRDRHDLPKASVFLRHYVL